MRNNFKCGMSRPCKDDGTPLTETDTAINTLVLESIVNDYPHVAVLGEEGDQHVDGAEYRIVCDPVDGTIPFSRGLPISTFCISVLRGDEPLVALIHDPFMNRTWTAVKGNGAVLTDSNGVWLMKVSAHGGLRRSNISLIWWAKADYNLSLVATKLMDEGVLWGNYLSVAIFGGLVGSGEYDASIFPGRHSLETPAMQLIVEEAGGRATDIHGNTLHYGPKGETDGHIISNGLIHDQLVEIVHLCR
ncbi:MAG: inositol monophosphatase [Candidatus Zambryskibacteria bacterium]|nr:inositol monophosphatase [Candidatus Zambryskibacteria bacterium]